MRRLLLFPAAVIGALAAVVAYGQDYELLVIEDDVVWPVDRNAESTSREWWLLRPTAAHGAPLRVEVTHGEPYCDGAIETCSDEAWSQAVEVRAVDAIDAELAPPYYLLQGPVDPGAAGTAATAGRFDLDRRESRVDVAVGGNDYRITRRRSDDDARIVVNVGDGATVQQLYACETGGAAYPYCGDEGYEDILWAGDVDADGRLDLIAQFTPKYSIGHYYLFVSSGAEPGRLVRAAAEFSRYFD